MALPLPDSSVAAWSVDRTATFRDQAAVYERIWQQFLALDVPRPHRQDWAGWVDGRGPLLLLVARVRAPAVLDRVETVRARLCEVPGLELLPDHFLHVTVQSCGFLAPPLASPREGELDREAMRALVPRLAAQLSRVAPFRVDVGGLNAFYSAAFLELHSGGWLAQVRRAARAAAETAATWPDPGDGFVFHLTLGYFDGQSTVFEACRAIDPLRDAYLGSACVDEVELVQVPADQREAFPPFSVRARFPLGEPPAPR